MTSAMTEVLKGFREENRRIFKPALGIRVGIVTKNTEASWL